MKRDGLEALLSPGETSPDDRALLAAARRRVLSSLPWSRPRRPRWPLVLALVASSAFAGWLAVRRPTSRLEPGAARVTAAGGRTVPAVPRELAGGPGEVEGFDREGPPVPTSWLGNSVGAGAIPVPRYVAALYAAPGGTLFVMGGGGDPVLPLPDAVLVRDGVVQQRLAGLEGHLGRSAGRAITGTGRHVFAAVDQYAAGVRPFSPGTEGARPSRQIRRYDLDGAPAPFEGGEGDGSFRALGEGPPIVALTAADGALFVVQAGSPGLVTVLDAATVQPRRSFPVMAAQGAAAAGDGALWVIEAGRMVRYGADGAGTVVEVPGAADLTAVAAGGAGRLLLGDAAGRVLAFVPAAGTATVVAEPALGPITAVTPGDAGPVVATNAGGIWGARLAALDGRGRPRWSLDALVSYEAAAVDPATDGEEAYTKLGRFRLEAGRPARLIGTTPAASPALPDPRLTPGDDGGVRLVRRDGHRFLVHLGAQGRVTFYRFEGHGGVVPAAMIATREHPAPAGLPPARAWLWRDLDGDGRPAAIEHEPLELRGAWGSWVDERGDVWRASETDGVDVFPLESVDERGVPVFRAASRQRTPMPAPFRRVQRVVHDADSGAVYLSGYTTDHPNPFGAGAWTSMGAAVVRYDDWRTHPRARWQLRVAREPALWHRPNGFAVAGDRLFVTYVNDAAIYVADAAAGRPLGFFVPGPEVEGRLNTGRASLPLSAFRRSTGEILLFAAHPIRSTVVLFRVPQGWPAH